jgi:hypothetical protein
MLEHGGAASATPLGLHINADAETETNADTFAAHK